MLRRRTPRGQAGYTLVELMMAIALFTVAVLGIISMQRLMIVSNAHAKNVSVAERIAQSWAAQLQLDSTNWRTDLTTTNWLSNVGGNWVRPFYVGGRTFGAAFDALGNPLTDDAADLKGARYCANVRLTYLYSPTTPVVGNGMMRAEIRVFWLRDGESTLNADTLCPVGLNMATVNQATDRYQFVYQTTGVRQHASI
jgi:prepilin-type N-terminal cleavage/methylation domain-containing protein